MAGRAISPMPNSLLWQICRVSLRTHNLFVLSNEEQNILGTAKGSLLVACVTQPMGMRWAGWLGVVAQAVARPPLACLDHGLAHVAVGVYGHSQGRTHQSKPLQHTTLPQSTHHMQPP